MMARPRRKSVRPTFEMSTPSMTMEPDVSSTRRYRAVMMELLPAPVLKKHQHEVTDPKTSQTYRPTIPIFSPGRTDMVNPLSTSGRPGRYFNTTLFISSPPLAGHGAGGFWSGRR